MGRVTIERKVVNSRKVGEPPLTSFRPLYAGSERAMQWMEYGVACKKEMKTEECKTIEMRDVYPLVGVWIPR